MKLKSEQEQLQKDKENIQDQVNNQVKTKLAAEKSILEKSIRTNLKEETAEQIQNLQKELEEKSGQVKDLNKAKAK